MDAVEYLYGLGRRGIGWIFRYRSTSDRKKYEGYLKGVSKVGLQPHTLVVSEKSISQGLEATGKLLDAFPDTDAIMYSSDLLAVGGVHCLHAQHISIPERIAVVGFNNSSSAMECYPPLTSVDNSIDECGTAAADMIVRMLGHEQVDSITVPCGLVIRASTEGAAPCFSP